MSQKFKKRYKHENIFTKNLKDFSKIVQNFLIIESTFIMARTDFRNLFCFI